MFLFNKDTGLEKYTKPWIFGLNYRKGKGLSQIAKVLFYFHGILYHLFGGYWHLFANHIKFTSARVKRQPS